MGEQLIRGADGLMHVQPALPAHAMRSFQIVQPLATHWRDATCEEAGCEHHLHGWRTIVAADSPQAAYIRQDRTRRHAETREAAGVACFTFEPGQRCFGVHKVPTGRPQRYFDRGGDWRGNPRGDVAELNAADWLDSFASHQDKIATAMERG
jgi:hypothetical protein